MIDHVAEGLRRGLVTEASLAASHARIASLLADAPSHAVAPLDEGVFERHATLAPLRSRDAPNTGHGGATRI
jgi:hypothetical protein